MFYTKYRPQKFSDISRPNEAADALSKQVISQKTAHAYLFIGPRGTGKTSTARILAKAINCPKVDKSGDPCDECDVCKAIKTGSYIDLIEIDAASNRGIDDIRELKNKIKLAPAVGKFKIYIVDEVHMLTSEAFNALLKTLEEPPKNTIFILCTTESHKVPDTIKSRCQVFRFRRATIKQLVDKLSRIADLEALSVTKNDLEVVARASQGGFRDAENMLQQIAEGEITAESLLSYSSKDKYLEFCQYLWEKDAQLAFRTVNKIFGEGADLYIWLGEIIKHLRDLIMLKSGMSADDLEIPSEAIDEIKKQATSFDILWLVSSLEVLLEAQSKIRTSFIPQLPVEIAVSKICQRNDVPSAAFSVSPKVQPSGGLSSKDKDLKAKVSSKEEPVENEREDIKAPQDSAVTVNIEVIIGKWADVTSRIDAINKSILGLLKSSKPSRIEGRFLIFEVFYSFHKERLESPKTRQVVEKVLKEIFDEDIKVRCEISNDRPTKLEPKEVGVLTDYNVTIVDKDSVLEMLDGGLPL